MERQPCLWPKVLSSVSVKLIVPVMPLLSQVAESSCTVLKGHGLMMQRAGINSYAQLPVTTTVEYFTDSGCGDWLIPK